MMIKIFIFIIMILSMTTINTSVIAQEEVYYAYYGYYPQEVIPSGILYDELYFLSDDYLVDGFDNCYQFNDEYYCKYTTGVLPDNRCFNDGTKIYDNRVYFFEVQPVLWQVLDYHNRIYYSDVILDYASYDSVISEITKIVQYLECFDISGLNLHEYSIDHSSVYQTVEEGTLGKAHLLDFQTLEGISDKKALCSDYALAKGLPIESVDGTIYGEYWSSGIGTTLDYMMYVRCDGEYIYNKKVSETSGIRLIIQGV